MSVPWHARLRVVAVKKIADLIRVPILVLLKDMPEYRLAENREYLERCCNLFGPIFPIEKLTSFQKFAEQYLIDSNAVDNPFLLHSDPLVFVMEYLGIFHYGETTHEYLSTWQRYDEWQFKINSNSRRDFPDDIQRIKQVLKSNGYNATDDQCSQLWELYSDSHCAGWLILPELDESIFVAVKPFMERFN